MTQLVLITYFKDQICSTCVGVQDFWFNPLSQSIDVERYVGWSCIL